MLRVLIVMIILPDLHLQVDISTLTHPTNNSSTFMSGPEQLSAGMLLLKTSVLNIF